MSSASLRALQPLKRGRRGAAFLLHASSAPSAHHQFTSLPASRSKMADQTIVFTKDAPFPVGPYSQGIKTPFAVFCSGQIPADGEGKLIEGTIAEKTRQCCKNVEAVLTEAGTSLSRVVKTTIFISDMAHFAEMNAEYEKFFSHKPARSCVAAKALPKNVDVEIEAIALPGN